MDFICNILFLVYRDKEFVGHVNLYHLFNVRLVSSFVLAINGVVIKSKGIKNRPKEPGLYLFNHASDYDSWALYKTMKGRYAFVGKKALRNIVMVRSLASSIGTLYVENGNNEQNYSMVDNAVEYITKKDTSVVIAPEGTRNFTGKILPFKHGGFNIAKRCKCPIYLVGIKGMEKTMDKKYKGLKKVQIELFGIIQPNEYEGFSAGQIAELCEGKYHQYFGDIDE